MVWQWSNWRNQKCIIVHAHIHRDMYIIVYNCMYICNYISGYNAVVYTYIITHTDIYIHIISTLSLYAPNVYINYIKDPASFFFSKSFKFCRCSSAGWRRQKDCLDTPRKQWLCQLDHSIFQSHCQWTTAEFGTDQLWHQSLRVSK